jgi:dienelactone hydrolase
MAELVLFHHAQRLTAGCLSFADELRAAGHIVHAPDLYDGKTFAELGDGQGEREAQQALLQHRSFWATLTEHGSAAVRWEAWDHLADGDP